MSTVESNRPTATVRCHFFAADVKSLTRLQRYEGG